MDSQREIWQAYSESISADSIVRSFHRPAPFQLELADLISSLLAGHTSPRVAELGCETGVTLMLVKRATRRVFLDYDEGILGKVALACQHLGIDGEFVCEDMFHIAQLSAGSLDLVFNSGVIEHYDRGRRAQAISEYSRLLAPGGLMVIAYPNHMSALYRSAYTFRRSLGVRYWPWPAEHRIANLRHEMAAAGIEYIDTHILDFQTIPTLYNAFPGSTRVVAALGRMLALQGYLRVCIGRRPQISQEQPHLPPAISRGVAG